MIKDVIIRKIAVIRGRVAGVNRSRVRRLGLCGKPGTGGYHNRAWAAAMVALGLQPSSTGAPGGKETGYRVGHYIIPGGPFDVSYAEFEATGHAIEWGDAFSRGNSAPAKPKRLKFVCPACRENVMGKAATDVRCNPCNLVMVPEVKTTA